MKIRLCYVSNSSSSSYICDVCGHCESGYDLSICDANMYQCECHGHVFCKDEMVSCEDVESRALFVYNNRSTLFVHEMKEIETLYEKKSYQELAEKYDSFVGDVDNYETPVQLCPICQMIHLCKDDELSFFETLFGMEKNDVFKMIKSMYGNYDEFFSFLYPKK